MRALQGRWNQVIRKQGPKVVSSSQALIQQEQRLRQNASPVCAIIRLRPFFGGMASTLPAGHKDHTHRCNASDEDAIVSRPAWQPGAIESRRHGGFLDGALNQWRAGSR